MQIKPQLNRHAIFWNKVPESLTLFGTCAADTPVYRSSSVRCVGRRDDHKNAPSPCADYSRPTMLSMRRSGTSQMMVTSTYNAMESHGLTNARAMPAA